MYLPYLYPLLFVFLSFLLLFKIKLINKKALFFIALLFFSYAWVLLISGINSKLDTDILLTYINGLLSFIASTFIVRIIYKNHYNNTSNTVIYAIYMSGFIHGVIMILSFLFPFFRNFLYSFVSLGNIGEIFVETMTRSPGLSSGGGDSLSVIQAIALIFGMHYYFKIEKHVSFIKSIIYLISFLVLIFSIFLSARTGLVILLFYLLFSLLIRIFSFFKKLSINQFFLFKVSLISIILIIITPVFFNLIMESEYSRFGTRAFELYFNYIESGELGTSSSENLKNMYFLPQNKLHLWFGDGNFGRNGIYSYIPSDVGYVRMIFGGGIIGTTLMFIPLLYIYILCFFHRMSNNTLSTLVTITILVILITNIKVFHYLAFRESFKVLFLLFSTYLIAFNNEKKSN